DSGGRAEAGGENGQRRRYTGRFAALANRPHRPTIRCARRAARDGTELRDDSMAKKRGEDQVPFMPAPDYGRSLQGLSVNLLVRDIARAVTFQRDVLGVACIYADPDFA